VPAATAARAAAPGDTLDSLDQGVHGLAVRDAVHGGAVLRFTVPASGASYRGTSDADGRTVHGTWQQRDRAWPLARPRDDGVG
jgi:hypothetical protein